MAALMHAEDLHINLRRPKLTALAALTPSSVPLAPAEGRLLSTIDMAIVQVMMKLMASALWQAGTRRRPHVRDAHPWRLPHPVAEPIHGAGPSRCGCYAAQVP